jgi:transcriptional regulator with XRE-family HTH domain
MSDLNKFFQKQMEDEEFRKEYDALTPKYEVIKEIIKERNAQNLTPKQFADKIGIKQSNISRLESGNYNPSMDFLQRIAQALQLFFIILIAIYLVIALSCPLRLTKTKSNVLYVQVVSCALKALLWHFY